MGFRGLIENRYGYLILMVIDRDIHIMGRILA